MAYSISYQSHRGVVAVPRNTTQEALEKAMEWLLKDRENVMMTDLDSGKTYDATEMRLIHEQIERLGEMPKSRAQKDLSEINGL